MLKLHNLCSAGKKRKRVGRGGVHGGTSCRGNGGQNKRSGGGVSPLFEGGQMPLVRRLPKRGFTNASFKTRYEVINLGHLNDRFDDGALITYEALVENGIVRCSRRMIKILGDGILTKKFVVHAHAASQEARNLIERQGGSFVLIPER